MHQIQTSATAQTLKTKKLPKLKAGKNSIKAIFFDLDRCIFDTNTLGKEVLDPVLEALENADINQLFSMELETIRDALWTQKLDTVIHENNIPSQIGKAMKKAYSCLKATHGIQPFDDVVFLPQIEQKKILVTTGFEQFQTSKIQTMNIGHYFDEIIIDAIDEKQAGKKEIFSQLLRKYDWKAGEVMVIGDNPESELKAGKELGMKTVQCLRSGIKKTEGFDHYINGFDELLSLLK